MIWGQKNEDRYRPHWWFAWYIVELSDGRFAWLQYVWCKQYAVGYDWVWEYSERMKQCKVEPAPPSSTVAPALPILQ